jgi:hypothetical protein
VPLTASSIAIPCLNCDFVCDDDPRMDVCVVWEANSCLFMYCVDDPHADSHIVEDMSQVNDSGIYCLRRSTEIT